MSEFERVDGRAHSSRFELIGEERGYPRPEADVDTEAVRAANELEILRDRVARAEDMLRSAQEQLASRDEMVKGLMRQVHVLENAASNSRAILDGALTRGIAVRAGASA